MTTVAIMQPYFLPYIGYFQLIHSADRFVLYDNIKYTKQTWINRNRMLLGNRDAYFSLPLRKASDSCWIGERQLAHNYSSETLERKFSSAYRHAPMFESVFELLQRIFRFPNHNLFDFLYHSITSVMDYLGLSTELIISSRLDSDEDLKCQARVLDLCRTQHAEFYINPIGGVDLYSAQGFQQEGISLRFLQSRPLLYRQFDSHFVPSLSIADVLMFNSIGLVQDFVAHHYDLIETCSTGKG